MNTFISRKSLKERDYELKNKTIPVFYACDDNFVKYMIVSLHSMIKNASKDRSYCVHVLHTDISEEMRAEILKLQNECFTIKFVNVSEYLKSISDKLPVRHYYTKSTYFRLFLADMFEEYDKAIYIDSDTIVKGDISKLYDIEIGDSLVGACHEQAMVQVDVYGTYAERVVGVSRHNFFNAGMLLINSRMWRKTRLLDKFLFYLGEYNFVVTQDEDYLNLICKDHVHWLDQRWNTAVAEGFEYPYDVEEAYILHYIMVNKPWHYENCRMADTFWSYAKDTDVYGMLREELNAYTEEERERDRLSAENLYQMAIEETNKEDNYQNILNKTKRSPDRVAVVKKIEEYEIAGKFDLDVEDDPPTRELLPDEIDYLRRSPIAKLKTYIAYLKAKKFLKYIKAQGLMIIRDIRGLENLKSLSTGAILTCNHFNPLDTFAVHEAFLRSEVKDKKLYRVIREGNYTSFPGFYGYLMRHFYTLPLSSNRKTMRKFTDATCKLLSDGNLVLIYPEQSMWWNYRKPKPLKSGAYSLAVKCNVPILPIFITMRDSEKIGDDGYPIQEYTVNIGEPIYPNALLGHKECLEEMMKENSRVWQEIYEREYDMPLSYTTAKETVK